MLSPGIGACLMGLGMTGAGCGGFAWWITGMVWRFNAAGSFAAGDVPEGLNEVDTLTYEAKVTADGSLYQYSSGNFMYIYYLITWITLGVSCGCGILGSLAACICAK
jgi:hypothetical protein